MSVSHLTRIEPPRLVTLPQVTDERGNLTFIEGGVHLVFAIERIYYLYDVPGGAERGGHAHKAMHQMLIALSGSFDVHVDNGRAGQSFHLNRAYTGLYIPPMNWRAIDNFSGGSVCLAIVSTRFDESDYIRDYDEYRAVARTLDAG